MLNIRPATEYDLTAMLEIYNESVLNSNATFDTEPRSHQAQMSWFKQHKKNHPVLVAEQDDQIIGWASLSPFSDRCAYDTTVEVSIYIHKDHRGKGMGIKLLKIITLEGQKVGNHTIISRITQGNDVSIHIHEKLGYRHVGVMEEVGFKFAKFQNVHIMQYLFNK
ncbi:MAG TPA: N-acetyltransferase family protein [Bacteroidia bacterium]|nr:N-acetyltransferase family protein [Bacteroidia bacterium]